MHKRLLIMASLLALAYINPLLADTPKAVDCKNASSAQDRSICAQQQLTKLNNKLSDTYTKSLTAATQLDKTPNGNIKKSLEIAQQNWANYLKASCDNVATVYQGANDATTQVSDCKKQIIKTRTKQLAQLYLNK